MTYEDFCKNLEHLKSEEKRINTWRKTTMKILLTDLASRIWQLGENSYMGCGFHYALEQRLAKLIEACSMPAQFCANHCDKIDAVIMNHTVDEVVFESLVELVENAEKSAKTET